MKESIGLTVTINIIIIFTLTAFVFIVGIYTYYKAFKASSLIIKSLEKYEGYNDLAYNQINKDLYTVGYLLGDSSKCSETKNATIGEGRLVTLDNTEKFQYCIYFFDNDGDEKHYSYGVVTYMSLDFYMFGTKVKFPIFGRTRRIYRYTNT